MRWLLVLGVVAVAGRAHARAPLSIGVKAGANLPRVGSPLGSGLAVGVEADRRVAGPVHLALAVDASQRPREGTQPDPMLEPGAFDWSVIARQLDVSLELRVELPVSSWRVYAGAGPALVLVETRGGGSIGDAPLGEVTERSAVPGLSAQLGVLAPLGTGAISADLHVSRWSLDHDATGHVQGGAATLRIGYRFYF